MDNRIPQDVADFDYIDLSLRDFEPENSEFNIIDNKLHLFLQEVEIAIKMMPGDVWGIYDYLDVRKYVFNRYVTITQIKREVLDYLIENCGSSRYFNYDVSVETVKSPNSGDLIYIQLRVSTLNQNNQNDEVVQKFLLGAGAEQIQDNQYRIPL